MGSAGRKFCAVFLTAVCCSALWPANRALGGESEEPSAKTPAIAIAEAVQLTTDALRAEVAGNDDQRDALLKQAVEIAPGLAPARWQTGQVRLGDEWLTVDEAIEKSAANPRLTEYRRRRAAAKHTIPEQLELARWCKFNDLTEQQRAHLALVLMQDNRNAQAMAGLELKEHRGILLREEQLPQLAEKARLAERAKKEWQPKLHKLRRAVLGRNEAERDKALAELRAVNDPEAINSLREVFSLGEQQDELLPTKQRTAHQNREVDANLEMVSAFGRMPEYEATLALAREAVVTPVDEVRRAAVVELQKRPLQHFIPTMLSGMQSPVESSYQVTQDERGRMHYIHTLFRAGPLEDVRHKYHEEHESQFFYTVGNRLMSIELPVRRSIVNATKSRAAALDKAVKKAGEPLIRTNERLAAVLSKVTDQSIDADPSRWWKWWFDYNELVSYDQKPVREYTYRDYYSDDYTRAGRRLIRRPDQTMASCFAAGTLVWTDCGPQEIQTLKIGDLVLAKDTETGELAFKPVVGGTLRKPAPMLRIRVGKDELLSTRGHPFWVSGRGWTMAKELTVGMNLHTATGSLPIAAIDPADPMPTYNLVVADFDTYFVGQERVFVHDVRPAEPTIAVVPGLSKREVIAP